MSGWQKVSPSGAHKKEKVLAECQAGLWEAFRSSFCLSGTTSRTSEARSGTGTEMIQAWSPECVAVPEPCDERPDRLFKPISLNPRGGIKVCSDFS